MLGAVEGGVFENLYRGDIVALSQTFAHGYVSAIDVIVILWVEIAGDVGFVDDLGVGGDDIKFDCGGVDGEGL